MQDHPSRRGVLTGMAFAAANLLFCREIPAADFFTRAWRGGEQHSGGSNPPEPSRPRRCQMSATAHLSRLAPTPMLIPLSSGA